MHFTAFGDFGHFNHKKRIKQSNAQNSFIEFLISADVLKDLIGNEARPSEFSSHPPFNQSAKLLGSLFKRVSDFTINRKITGNLAANICDHIDGITR